MDVRQFFTHQTWWGKFLGVCFGFLTAGPTGALCGLLIGNFFDKGLNEHFSKPYWHYLSEKNLDTKQLFLKTLFLMLGHISKNKGHVSTNDIHMAEEIMQHMELNATEQQAARNYFNTGKQPQFTQERVIVLQTFKQKTTYNRPLLQLFLSTLYQAIQTNGCTTPSVVLMNNILNELNLAPMHKQTHIFDDFASFYTDDYAHANYNTHYQTYTHTPHTLNTAYTELNLQPNANKTEVKRAYRRLISKHHPDKLIAKNASPAEVKAANEKTQRIRKAYETICSHIEHN